jgi:hypothetical protein
LLYSACQKFDDPAAKRINRGRQPRERVGGSGRSPDKLAMHQCPARTSSLKRGTTRALATGGAWTGGRGVLQRLHCPQPAICLRNELYFCGRKGSLFLLHSDSMAFHFLALLFSSLPLARRPCPFQTHGTSPSLALSCCSILVCSSLSLFMVGMCYSS